jgi:hypothetical protein
MAKVKLFGLVLIITTSILALAAIATQTNQIRIRNFRSNSAVQTQDQFGNSFQIQSNSQFPPNAGMHQPFNQPDPFNHQHLDNSVEFVSIPIVLPLSVAGLLGMMLWFTPIQSRPSKISGRRNSPRRRR